MTEVTTHVGLEPFDDYFVGDLIVQVQNTEHGLRAESYQAGDIDGKYSDPIRDELCEFFDSFLMTCSYTEERFKVYVRIVEKVNHDKLH